MKLKNLWLNSPMKKIMTVLKALNHNQKWPREKLQNRLKLKKK